MKLGEQLGWILVSAVTLILIVPAVIVAPFIQAYQDRAFKEGEAK